MIHHQLTLKDAFHQVKIQRPMVMPNLGFFRFLLHLESQLYAQPSIPLVFLRTHDEQLASINITVPLSSHESADLETWTTLHGHKST
jgi:hypothetical protein